MALSAGQIMEYGEKQALAAIFRVTQSPAIGNMFLALLTAAPAAGTDLTMAAETEYTATSYARQTISDVSWTGPSSASPSIISNTNTVTFGPFTGTSPGTTVTWGALCDASSGTTANLAVTYLLSSGRTPATGDSLQAAANAFTCQV